MLEVVVQSSHGSSALVVVVFPASTGLVVVQALVVVKVGSTIGLNEDEVQSSQSFLVLEDVEAGPALVVVLEVSPPGP